jgi:signal transduction histidine kinase
LRVNPICDDNDKVKYYVITARDLTAERDIYLEQQHHNQEMEKANKAINQYEDRLQYLLEKSDMYVWKFDLITRQIEFARSLRTKGVSMSRDEFVEDIYEDEREEADRNLIDMIQRGEDFNAIHHFYQTPTNPNPCWYALSGMPERNEDGLITSYFGVARDVTYLMETQQKLKQETSRAEDSGRMKSAFLANMTHEIRTPLNAIVGFSDLLPVIDSQDERMEFIRIIRNNCDMLMRLINDILEASSMGQALAIKPTEVDFSSVFDDICQTLAQRVQEPGVEFIKDNPYPTCRTVLDKGRVQQVLTNFVTNAVKYTHKGFIKVGYHWESRMKFDGSGEADGLTIYCLDTGAGIPKEKQASVFERFVKLNDFVQGTGLGLSICQNIVERCNGHIGVTSEGEGHGSSFWFWIPCEKK